MTPRQTNIALYGGLVLLTLAVYAQARDFAYILYDDPQYITNNETVLGGLSVDNVKWALTTGDTSNWHPLTWLSLMSVVEAFGPGPGPQHVVNVIFHVLNALLLLYVLHRATGAPLRSALVAFLFALHPLHVESVAWVSERKDVLSTLFWMLSTWAYLRYTDRRTLARYVLVVGLYGIGLTAKPMLVTLPCVLLLMDYWPLGRLLPREGKTGAAREGVGSILLEKVPLFCLAAASSAATILAGGTGGAVADLERFSLFTRLGNAVVSYATYLVKAVFPMNLGLFYVHRHEQLSISLTLGAIGLLAALSVVCLWYLRRHRYLAVGWLWYLGTLVPVIGIVQVGEQAMADRYTYVPLIGIFIMVSWGLGEMAAWRPRLQPAIRVAVPVAVAFVAMLSYLQAGYWSSDLSLFSHAVVVEPRSDRAHTLLGKAWNEAGRPRDALRNFDKAIALHDTAASHMGKGDAYLAMGSYGLAFRSFVAALERDPELAEAYNNIGGLLAMRGQFERAAEYFDLAEQHRPGYESARLNKERALQMLEKTRNTP